ALISVIQPHCDTLFDWLDANAHNALPHGQGESFPCALHSVNGILTSHRVCGSRQRCSIPMVACALGVHGAVYTDGTLCLDILQDQWSPCHNVCTLLTSIQSLLTDPNCSSPANPEAAQLYNTDRTAFNKRVRRLAQKSIEG
ncbi:hypothetical protein QJQ45_018737, partial [Haematococcus lacustris]